MVFLIGKRNVTLEICSEQKKVARVKSVKHSLAFSGLELKLDELRKELSSIHGGIFPHSILSTQQINMLSAQKPNSMEEASFTTPIFFCFFVFFPFSIKFFSHLRLLHVNFSTSVCDTIDFYYSLKYSNACKVGIDRFADQ